MVYQDSLDLQDLQDSQVAPVDLEPKEREVTLEPLELSDLLVRVEPPAVQVTPGRRATPARR